MKNKPLVTIAIPVYNAEPYLCNAIQSVINQTYKEWILYLVNDGSTDSSLAIMQEFANNDSRIIIVNDGENKGLIDRLNQSIKMANTKYYARMDADDIMSVNRIKEQIHYMELHPEVDVLGSSAMLIDDKNRIVGSYLKSGEVQSFIHPSVIGKTSWFKDNPYCQWAHRAEDFELWSRTLSKSVFWSLDKPLLFYREFGVPVTKKYIDTQKTLLKIYYHYRDYDKSMIWFLKNSFASICKIIAYCIFDFFGDTKILLRMRRRLPVDLDKSLGEKDLLESIITNNI